MNVMQRHKLGWKIAHSSCHLWFNKGAAPMVARLTPFSGAYSQVGPKGSDRYFKYLEPQKDVVTKKNYDKARESWLKEKSKSNEKAQKDLEKHVK